jgi:hypothetical protein
MDIAQLVLKLTGSTSHIESNPLPVDDPKVRRLMFVAPKHYLVGSRL